MPRRGVDRLLQIHAGMDVAQEELGRPLVLLIAARRAPGEVGFAVAQSERRRERGARAFAGRERGGVARLEPEHLRARAETESEFWNDRGGLQPAAGRRRGDHVAGAVDDIEMHGVAAHLSDPPDGRFAGAERADRRALAGVAPQLDDRAEAFDRAGFELQRRGFSDELAPPGVVGLREQRRHRHLDELRIAVKALAVRIGELGGFDLEMDEIGPGRVDPVELEALEDRELLQHHRTLAPGPGLADRVAAIVVGERRLDGRLPIRHVGAG